jgi:protein-S-isoprenylcysteine O-methyltransferase Ste14
LIIIVYLLFFALVHSVLADLRIKRAVAKFRPDFLRWYRLAYNIIATVTALPILYFLAVLPDRVLYQVPTPWSWMMILLQLTALACGVQTLHQTGIKQFLGLSSEEGSLITEGSYCWVRNPLFLFAMVILWLSPVMTQNLLVVNALLSLYFYLGTFHEEDQLLVQFGSAYHEYRRRVPRFIPRYFRCKGS